MELLTAEVKEKVCTGYLNYNCITCDYFSRDLPAVCAQCPGNEPGHCVDCVSCTECAYRALSALYGVEVNRNA